jgi:GT2 family glycosyltransferase
MSVLISMMIGSPKSTLFLVKQSIESIIENIGDPEFKLLIGIAPYINREIINYLFTYSTNDHIELIPDCKLTFAEFVNLASQKAYDEGYEWEIEAHDDVKIVTPNLIQEVEKLLLCDRHIGKADKIGWISFLDKDYLNAQWAPSIREGFALDAMKEGAWGKKKTHQFHTLPDNWWSFENTREYLESLPYDIPSAPVICHAPFSHFIMANTRTLYEKIGKCPDWSPVSLLVDEDRGLKAMAHGLYNLWLPSIEYIHCRSGGTRAWEQIRMYGPTVHAAFRAKWGFEHKAIYSDAELQTISSRYFGTNIGWSIGRRTYEWCYW